MTPMKQHLINWIAAACGAVVLYLAAFAVCCL